MDTELLEVGAPPAEEPPELTLAQLHSYCLSLIEHCSNLYGKCDSLEARVKAIERGC